MLNFWPKIRYLTRSDFFSRLTELEGGHWTKDLAEARWDYHNKVKKIVRTLNPASPKDVLEIGTVGMNVVRGSSTLDFMERWDFPGKAPTFAHDARVIPWPIANREFEVLIALRVFQHLTPNQMGAFLEARRVSRHVILVVPEAYANPVLPKSRGIPYNKFVQVLDGIHPNLFERTSFGELYHWDCERPSTEAVYY